MLEIKNLTKVYGDGKKALDDVSLTIKPGEFVALLGPNGAGKTTLINSLVGNTDKTNGTIIIGGHNLDIDPLSTKMVIGVVPQEISFDGFFTVGQVLRHQMGYFGQTPNEDRIDELLGDLGLLDKKDANTRALSGGMKRRLLIAKALVHKPDLFILDEPTAGVDIELRQSLYTYLEKLHRDGVTMILTTHYLEEAERLCERIVVIDEGKCIADAPKKQLMEQLGHKVHLKFTGVTSIPDKLSGYGAVSENDVWEVCIGKNEVPEFMAKLNQFNVSFSDFVMKEASLEDVFLTLVQK